MKIELEFPYNDYVGYKIFHKKEGRWYICLLKEKKRKTISYARYLMSVKEKRILNKDEQVDHINNIKDDDRIENLQILTSVENHQKSHITKCKNIICPTCKKEFFQKRVTRIYCSKSCARQNPKELKNKKIGTKKYHSNVELPHGTKNCYSYHKCRCELCTNAHRLSIKNYKDNLF